MPRTRESYQQAGRIGGLMTGALGDTRANSQKARDTRDRQYRDQVLKERPELAGDEAEISRRVARLRQAHMVKMSMKAAEARKLRAEAARLEADLDSSDA